MTKSYIIVFEQRPYGRFVVSFITLTHTTCEHNPAVRQFTGAVKHSHSLNTMLFPLKAQ